MKEQLVTYDTAILAKKKGFNIPVQYGVYGPKMKLIQDLGFRNNPDLRLVNWNTKTKQQKNSQATSVPSQSLLQKWLREKHKLVIEIKLTHNSKEIHYFPVIYNCNVHRPIEIDLYDVMNYIRYYEDALEKALQEALKLI